MGVVMKALFLFFVAVLLGFGAFTLFGGGSKATLLEKGQHITAEKPDGYVTTTLAGGCFWCVESEYRGLDGVLFTRVGYMGGKLNNPSYRDITTGKTGHAEVVEVTFDPTEITYEGLLKFFLTQAHDPTQLNRQGVDRGTQYRSAIFPHDQEQREIAQEVIAELQPEFNNKIVTTIEPFGTFWEAEDYHQQYYEKYQAETGKDHIRVILKQAKKLKTN